MKNIFYKLIVLSIFSLIISCDDFGDINVDPTRSTSMDPANQLVYVQMRFTGDYVIPLRAAAGITMPLLQQIGGTFTNNSGATYAYSESIYTATWLTNYPGIVLNVVDAEYRTKDVPNKSNLNAMLRILKVLVFAQLTDLYGDIPYFEATKGYIDGNIHPKYDDQKDIYDDFFKELSEAYTQLDATKDKVPQDQFYAGDIAKWKKFANSLRLRCAMRLVKIDPAKAKAEAEAAVASGVFSSNSDICMTGHEDVQSSSSGEYRGNGMSGALTVRNDFKVVTTFIDLLKPQNIGDPVDPRLKVWFRCYPATTGTGAKMYTRPDITDQIDAYYAAIPGNNELSGIFGITAGSTNVSNIPALNTITINVPGVGNQAITFVYQRRQIANYLERFNAPSFILTYSEVELLLAEAAFKGWNVGTTSANTHYKNGIKASLEQNSLYPDALTISNANITSFVASKNLETGKELEQINLQLYFSLFLNPIEGFANWRRSGYPALLPVGTVAMTTPRRFQYPLNEIEQNKENVDAAIAKITGVAGNGVNSYLNRVWWDKE